MTPEASSEGLDSTGPTKGRGGAAPSRHCPTTWPPPPHTVHLSILARAVAAEVSAVGAGSGRPGVTLAHSCSPSRALLQPKKRPGPAAKLQHPGQYRDPRAGGGRPEGHRGAAGTVRQHELTIRAAFGGRSRRTAGPPGPRPGLGAEPGFRESKRERARSRSARSIARRPG